MLNLDVSSDTMTIIENRSVALADLTRAFVLDKRAMGLTQDDYVAILQALDPQMARLARDLGDVAVLARQEDAPGQVSFFLFPRACGIGVQVTVSCYFGPCYADRVGNERSWAQLLLELKKALTYGYDYPSER